MSKVITTLTRLDRSRQQQDETAAPDQPAPNAETSPDKNAWMFRLTNHEKLYGLGIMAVVCTVALILSLQAISQARRTREFAERLAGDISSQETRIAALEKSFQATTHQQAEQAQVTRQEILSLEEQVQKNSQEASETDIEINLLQADLDAVKQINQELTEQLIDLSEEIKIYSNK